VVQVTAAPPPELLLELDAPAPLPEQLALDPWPTPLLDAPLEPPKAPDELVPTPPELLVLLWPPLLLDPDDPLFPEELPDPDEPLPLLLPPMSKNALSPSSEGGGNLPAATTSTFVATTNSMLSTPAPVSNLPRSAPSRAPSSTLTPSVHATRTKLRAVSTPMPRGPSAPQPGFHVVLTAWVLISTAIVRFGSSRFV
jgi:hypothetical protein